jgi:hypothetical protein
MDQRKFGGLNMPTNLAEFLFSTRGNIVRSSVPLDEVVVSEPSRPSGTKRPSMRANGADMQRAFVGVNFALSGALFLIIAAVIVSWFVYPEREAPATLKNALSAILGYFGGAVASYFGGTRRS